MTTKQILDHLPSLVLFSSLLHACHAQDPKDHADVKTQLVDSQSLLETFNNYQEKAQHCRTVEGRPRVIISGFGLFGDPFNISGISTMSMAKPEFWPASVELSELHNPEPKSLEKFARHAELTTLHGGSIKQRTLKIDGKDYELCFLYLDVRWDLAASIILHESRLFKADLVIMSGMNGAERTRTTWESGALNRTGDTVGYHASGAKDLNNRPVAAASKIIESDPLDQALPLSWKAEELAQSNQLLIANVDPTYGSIVGQARSSNDYVCNNVSYAVMSGLSGQTVKLASELIVFEGQKTNAQVGFLHYPSDSSKAGMADNGLALYRWNQVLAQTIKTSLAP